MVANTGTYTLVVQTVMDGLIRKIYKVTDFTDDDVITESGMREIYHAETQIKTQDQMIGLVISDNAVTIDEGAGSYDGTLLIEGV